VTTVPTVISKEERDQVLGIAEETLRENWTEGERDGVGYGYSRPSPGHYPWQWYWDSCFHAIVWRRFDPERAESELRSLLAGGSEDGFIGHTIFWDRPVDWQRRWTYNVTSKEARNTSTIQPPLLAWAWRIAVGDPAKEPRIAAHHDWLEANRDLDGDGLLWICQPDESGLDSSPKFDPIWGVRAHARPLFPFLIARNRRVGWDVRRILDKGGPLTCEVVVNVLWCLARLAAGEPSITPAIVDRLWDERRGLFLDVARGRVARPNHMDPLDDGDQQVRVSTWSALAPLALPDLPEAIGRRLVEEHLLDTRRYWLPFPPTSVSAQEPTFQPRKWKGFLRRLYWRGPTWINSAWLIWLGLLRHGYDPEAMEMSKRLADAVANERLREFYEPNFGEGLGAREFGWSSLIAELADPDRAAKSSYLRKR
jgi:Mannosylglycerate hydrolase MGH1-like glycoside hydrolase domain